MTDRSGEWLEQQLELVRTVSAQVANVLDLDQLTARVVDLTQRTFAYYYVALFTLEPGRDVLRLRASAGRSPSVREELPIGWEVRLGEGIIGHVAQSGHEVVANDVGREPRYRFLESLPDTRSEAVLPLCIEQRVLGVLDVQSERLNAFQETDLLVLHALADNVAIAVEHARLYSALRRQADQLAAVAEVSHAVVSILDLDALLEEIVRLINRKFGYPYVHLYTVDPVRQKLIHRAGYLAADSLAESDLMCSLDGSEGIASWVACHGETLLVNDVSADGRFHASLLNLPTVRAELAVPLVFGDETLGVLSVQSDRSDAFGEEERFLFEALADSVSIALRNAQLYRSERWRRQVADSMREVAGLLSSETDLDQLLDAILVELENTLPSDLAAIWLLEGENLCLAAVRGGTLSACVGDLTSGAGSWLGHALAAEQPLVRTVDMPPEPLGAAMGFPPDYSAIAAPLRAGERRLGVLMLAYHAANRYGDESRAMMTAFASYTAIAIENARLYKQARELALVSTVMLRVAEATQSLTSLTQVLDTIASLVPMLAGVERCALLLWDREAGCFVPTTAYGLTPAQRQNFERWCVAAGDEAILDELRATGAPLFVYDVATDSRLSGPTLWALGFNSLLVLPLLAQGEVVGAMLMDYQGDWATLSGLRGEELAIIQGIAHQAAIAVENTQLREAQQEEAYVAAALFQVAQAVTSLNTLDDILAAIVRITPILVGVERCLILVRDEQSGAFRPAKAYGVSAVDGQAMFSLYYPPDSFPLIDAVRERNEVVVQTVGRDAAPLIPPELAACFLGRGERRVMAAPASIKGELLGVVLLEEADGERRVHGRRLEIVNGIAHQVALAIQNDRLQQARLERERLDRELQLAHEIQSAFIPETLPELAGWELAATWRAAREVAGDFYDVFTLPDGRLALIVADVADKGMPAALFMAVTRTLVRAAALDDPAPDSVLERVNNLLEPDARHGMFVTALYGVLSPQTGELAYASAGHNPPFLLRAGNGQIERFNTGGIALGVLSDIEIPAHKTYLDPGDLLVCYTDGVTEAFSPAGEAYGEERLQATVRSLAGLPAAAVLEAIERSVAEFVGEQPAADDSTLVVVRRTIRDQSTKISTRSLAS